MRMAPRGILARVLRAGNTRRLIICFERLQYVFESNKPLCQRMGHSEKIIQEYRDSPEERMPNLLGRRQYFSSPSLKRNGLSFKESPSYSQLELERNRNDWRKEMEVVSGILSDLNGIGDSTTMELNGILKSQNSRVLHSVLQPWKSDINVFVSSKVLKEIRDPNLALGFYFWCCDQEHFDNEDAIFVYNNLISIMGRAMAVEEMEFVFGEMKSFNCKPDYRTFNSLLLGFGKSRMADKAQALWSEIRDKNVMPSTRGAMIYALCNGGECLKAMDLFKSMQSNGSQLDNFSSMNMPKWLQKNCLHSEKLAVDSFLDANKHVFLHARTALKKYLELSGAQRNKTVAMIVSSLRPMEVPEVSLHGASSVEELMKPFEGRITKFVACDVLKQLESPRAAMDFFAFASKQPKFCNDISVYNSLIRVMGRAKDTKGMNSILGEIKANGLSPDIVTYTSLMSAFKSLHAVQKVEEIWQEMIGRGIEPDQIAYGTMLDLYVHCCRYSEAVHIYEEMGGKFPDEMSRLDGLLAMEAYFKGGDSPRAAEILNGCLHFNGAKEAAHFYNKLIRLHSNDDNTDEALRLLKEMESNGCRASLKTYNTLILACARNGLASRVESLYEQMVGNGGESRAWKSILLHCSDLKHLHSIESWFRRMKSEGVSPEVNSFNALLCSLSHANVFQEARKVMEILRGSGLDPRTLQYTLLLCLWSDESELEATMELMDDKGHNSLRIVSQLVENAIKQRAISD